MEKKVSAAEASQLLREVGQGSSYVMTSYGRPV